jgi:hypothetical protein
MGWTTRVRFPAGVEKFFCSPPRITGSGINPVSFPVGTAPFPGIKRQERENDELHPYSAKIKNAWSYTFIPPYVFRRRT